ncbi:MAG TPA: ATP-binding protein, partial [Candidatus Angelobacter sp.]|nr:ATP-binding protein [Candidatus Angelobacter sp.]
FLSLSDERLVAQPTLGSAGSHYVLVAEMPRPVPPFRPLESAKHLLIAVSISGLICLLLARYLTAPIARLRQAAQQIAAGDLSARAADGDSKRRDEVAELVHDFDSMAARLESLIHAQNRLISNISHELRSPLARLSLALGLARQGSPDAASAPLDRIERETERLNELIGRLLTLARLQAPREKLPKTSFPLAELIREVVGDADFEARSRNCQVHFQGSEDCRVWGNPDVLRSALENVLRNAVRYTQEGTNVEVAVTCANGSSGKAVIAVRDHGPGVPEEELPNLFRPFYRLDQSRERETGGVGLGLAIAEQAVKFHQGGIVAKNAPGGGLQVEISIPMDGG